MTVRVEVQESEDVYLALRRLNKKAFLVNRRAWVKSRPGYYEKPSILRRKRHMMDARNRAAASGGGLRLWLGLAEQLAHSGPFAMAR
jgi:ribosomal protein S21